MPLILDTLIVTRRLRDAGIDQVHAEAHAEVARDLILADVASREELRHEFAQLRAELKAFEEALINRVTKIVARMKTTEKPRTKSAAPRTIRCRLRSPSETSDRPVTYPR